MVLALVAVAGLVLGWQGVRTRVGILTLGVLLALTVGLQTAVVLFARSPADITLLPVLGGVLLLAGMGAGAALRQVRGV